MQASEQGSVAGESPAATEIGVVLADDHAVVRSGLRMLLEAEPDIAVLAEAADVESASRYVLGHKPRVLVLDLNMGPESSLPAIPAILERSPETAIVVLTMQTTLRSPARPCAPARSATCSSAPPARS